MNEELQNAIIGLINKAVEAADKGADLLTGQLPNYVMQLLMWHSWYSLILCVSGVVLWFAVIYFDVKAFRYAYREDGGTLDSYVVVIWGTLGLLIRAPLYVIIFRLLNLTWLQIWIAPKVWLVEYAASLVK